MQTAKAHSHLVAFQDLLKAVEVADAVSGLKWWYNWVCHSRIPEMIKVAKSIKVHYSFRDKDGLKEHDVELVDAKFRECLALIQKTKLVKEEPRTGAASFDVTLTGAAGQSEMGTPSNRGDWAEFAQQIASAKAAASVKK